MNTPNGSGKKVGAFGTAVAMVSSLVGGVTARPVPGQQQDPQEISQKVERPRVSAGDVVNDSNDAQVSNETADSSEKVKVTRVSGYMFVFGKDGKLEDKGIVTTAFSEGFEDENLPKKDKGIRITTDTPASSAGSPSTDAASYSSININAFAKSDPGNTAQVMQVNTVTMVLVDGSDIDIYPNATQRKEAADPAKWGQFMQHVEVKKTSDGGYGLFKVGPPEQITTYTRLVNEARKALGKEQSQTRSPVPLSGKRDSSALTRAAVAADAKTRSQERGRPPVDRRARRV